MYNSKIIFVFSIFLSIAFANPHYYLPHNAYGAQPSIWSFSESEPSAKVSSSHSEPPCSNSVPVIKSAVSVPNVWNGIAPLPSAIHNGGTVSAVQVPVSHSNQKGETIIHRPAPIVVRRPPTKIQINHPPLVVKPAPVIFHKPPAKVIRPTVVKNLPQQVQVEPVFMKVLKPAEKKVIVSEPSCTSGVHYPVPYHHHHHHY